MTKTDMDVLKAAADVLVRMGVQNLAFVGEEVSKYGDGWLDLARHIRTCGPNLAVLVYTNGWWLDQVDFAAAGRRYPDVRAYLADLRDHGVSHVVFSLDGKGERHDHSRRHPGLYEWVMAGLDLVRAVGLEPRVSLLRRVEALAAVGLHRCRRVASCL